MEQDKTKTVAEDWPNTPRTVEELDRALREGEESGTSDRTADAVAGEAIRCAANR